MRAGGRTADIFGSYIDRRVEGEGIPCSGCPKYTSLVRDALGSTKHCTVLKTLVAEMTSNHLGNHPAGNHDDGDDKDDPIAL